MRRMNGYAVRNLRRGADVCGYGNEVFDQMASEMEFIRNVFVKSGIGKIEETELDDFRQYFSIKATNHFFTESKLVTNETYLPYPPQEDPFGYINACALKFEEKMPLVRVAENDVLFFKKVVRVNKEGKM